MPNRLLTVLVVGTSFDFPHGGGASSRVCWYAKGLAEVGDNVRIVSLVLPSRGGGLGGKAASGTYEGLAYEYACGTRVRSPAFWRRRWVWLRRAVRTARLVREAVDQSSGDCVILIYSEVSSWIVGLALLARTFGAKSVLDLCEFPLVWRRRSLLTFLHRRLRLSLVRRLTDGVIPISTYLENYVRQSTDRPPPMLLVPVMIDPALFTADTPEVSAAAKRQVLYCGGLTHFDEVERTVRVFAEAAADLNEVRLALVGGGPDELKARAESLVRSLALAHRVDFVDRIEREDLAARMTAAEVLVLPRAAGVFSQAGLPNKLGEYLASGRPVVTTANGDIPLYLQDGVNAYLVEPGDDAAFAARLRHALTHRAEASEVGAHGREVACARFDYRLHGARLHDFLETCVVARRAPESTVEASSSGLGPR